MATIQTGYEKDTRQRVHAVMLPYPAKGHSIPLLHLAQQLSALGVTITFVNVFNHISQEVFNTFDGLDCISIVGLGGQPVHAAGDRSLPFAKYVHSLEGVTEELLEKLTNENEGVPLTCIISDMFMGWTQDVANKFKIPRYVMFPSPATGLSTFLHIPMLVSQGRLPPEPTQGAEIVNDIPGVPPTPISDLPSPVLDASNFEYHFYMNNAERMAEATGVLLNSFYELEPFCIDVLQTQTYCNKNMKASHLISILPVGPLLPSAYVSTSVSDAVPKSPRQRRDACLEWLDTQPASSVLFVSFGSVAVLSLHQIHELALGLEASNHRFLLVVRSPQPETGFENLSLLPEGFEARTEGRGLVVNGWVPQLHVLSHPAVGGFLTHCGWNSTLESICRGVPMLGWPIQAEQKMNCSFLVDDVKAALEVHKGSDGIVEKAEVARSVKCLMNEPEGRAARRNVEKLRDSAMKAVAEDGSVQRNLQKFIELQSSYGHKAADGA